MCCLFTAARRSLGVRRSWIPGRPMSRVARRVMCRAMSSCLALERGADRAAVVTLQGRFHWEPLTRPGDQVLTA